MDLKKFFGAALTTLGTLALIYAAYAFLQSQSDWKTLVVTGVLGLLFFTAGINLIKGINHGK